MRCTARYTIGANIFFLVCLLGEGHEGPHWDKAIELDWMPSQPSEPDPDNNREKT